jgi:hypothetical protein
VEVFPTRVMLQGEGSSVALDLRGTIGDVPVGDSNQCVNLQNYGLHPTLPWQANIQIIGDLDESSFSTNTRAGTYTGTFTIRTTKL